MSKKYLIPNSGNFYKTCLHVHSTLSDGQLTPSEIKELYKMNGYSVIAITDHQAMLPHPELNDKDFLTITAAEVAKNKGLYNFSPSFHFNLYAKNSNSCTYPYFDPNSPWPRIEHIKNFYNEEMKNFKPSYFSYSKDDFNKVIEACNKEGFLVCFNHPKNGLQHYRDWGGIKGLFGMECYNRAGEEEGYRETMEPIDSLLTEGERKVYPIASDDAHSKETCCHGYIMVKADALEYSKIINALENGDFYASTGIHIKELYIKEQTLHIELYGTGADECTVRASIRFNKTVKSENGKVLKSIKIDLSPLFDMYRMHKLLVDEVKNAYFRIELSRKDGAMAKTKAYFLDEI